MFVRVPRKKITHRAKPFFSGTLIKPPRRQPGMPRKFPPRRPRRNMPTNRRRPIRRKTQSRVPRPLGTAGVYRFKREIDELVALVGTPDSWTLESGGAGTALGKTFAFALNSLGDYSDFQNLFKYYRIKGARVRMYFSNNVSRAEQSQNEASNKQIMIMLDRNVDGVGSPAETSTYLTSQTKKRFIALQGTRKPSVDVYMPLKQSADMFGTAGAPTALVSPKWLNTSDTEAAGVPHYGFNINMQRIDKGGFTTGISNSQYVRVITTLYIECKKVQ